MVHVNLKVKFHCNLANYFYHIFCKRCDILMKFGRRIVPQSCVMNASVSFMLSSYSKCGQLCFCQHNGTPSDEKFPLLQACLRGEK